MHRALFRTATGQYLNADVNGSYNILAKAAPEAFALGRRGCVVQPVRLELPNRTSLRTNPALVS
jgi:putative transposase